MNATTAPDTEATREAAAVERSNAGRKRVFIAQAAGAAVIAVYGGIPSFSGPPPTTH